MKIASFTALSALALTTCPHVAAFLPHIRASTPTFGALHAVEVTGSGPSSSFANTAHPVPSFLTSSFNTECDNINRPPSLNMIIRSLQQLTYSGSDIRGRFVNHPRLGSIASVAHEIGRLPPGSQPPLTPLAAYCFGYALAEQLLELYPSTSEKANGKDDVIEIAIGQDPRPHGMRLADALARGAQSADARIRVVYTGIATTPACAAFCPLHGCHAAVMVTASHLPVDRNGFKFFYRDQVTGKSLGMTNAILQDLGARAADCATSWFSKGILPPSSGGAEVMCSQHVQYMPAYAESLKQAVLKEVGDGRSALPLQGLKIVLNAGNGAGGFFQQVLQDLGADVSGSMHAEPDGEFPNGVPNPEYAPMLQATVAACEKADADLGIMLDTDADRCGFVAKTVRDGKTVYEPINRNRLIALLAVMFAESAPGCAIVTDSVTSEGLSTFLQNQLGLVHVRYLKGYMNVISKAKELTEAGICNAEVAIETSGHCAMKENDYMDDGTYTAVKVVSLLARQKRQTGATQLLDLIASMDELDEISEIRLKVNDDSLDTMMEIFDFCALKMEDHCAHQPEQQWQVDLDNLEGIRIRTGHNQFLMLRKSLHDPIISLQIEARSVEEARETMVQPLLRLFQSEERIRTSLNLSALEKY